jgi:hypothetical protein
MNPKNHGLNFITFTFVSHASLFEKEFGHIRDALIKLGHRVHFFTEDAQAGSGWRQVCACIADSDVTVLFTRSDDARAWTIPAEVRQHDSTYAIALRLDGEHVSKGFDAEVYLGTLYGGRSGVNQEQLQNVFCNTAQYA